MVYALHVLHGPYIRCNNCKFVFHNKTVQTGDSKRTLQVMNLSTGKPVKVSKLCSWFMHSTRKAVV